VDAVSPRRAVDPGDLAHHRHRRRHHQEPPVPKPQAAARDPGTKYRSHRMTTPGQDHDVREWEAQEQARRQARVADATRPSFGGSGFSRELLPALERSSEKPCEAGDASYRHVAEALRHPPPVDLPPDFAARVARIAELQTATSVTKSSRLKPLLHSSAFERGLT